MASTSVAFTTPSPPGTVHTPNTPKHGYSDNWEPYSPRKSARISEKRANARTPSPRSAAHQPTRTSRKSNSNFSTPAHSPTKKRMPAMDTVRRASATLTAQGAASAADSLGINPQPDNKSLLPGAATQSSAMLPTPSKTPRKQPDAKAELASRAIARNLFGGELELAAPTPKKKKAKKYTGLTLESFTAEAVEEPIAIFTDSRDRVPEVDDGAENPFYVSDSAPAVEEPVKRRSKRKQVTVPGEGKKTIEEAVKREDGIVYVFRGKKIFRKFSDAYDLDNDEEEIAEVEDEVVGEDSGPVSRSRPMTRSSIKPRLLFPPREKGKDIVKPSLEEEEAATDIEDHVLEDAQDDGLDVLETPPDLAAEKPDTPKAPRFAPASPPSTVRATRRATKLQDEDSPLKKPGKPRSPFDGWRRSKSRGGEPHGQKREGETLSRPSAATKRQRA
ncbi:hypothetical protein F5Y15DRAFT_371982 [Xylariaceae sp. FL0016]|nr:hypothetical protein F5Y15DRAFT_371982 [Xylariaceae sp. FL0016]